MKWANTRRPCCCVRLVYQQIGVWRVVFEVTFDEFALCLLAGTGFTHIAKVNMPCH